ncbi:MAG: 6-carboxytetrahydropterin synthase QueD [Omnitrophica WOR_2 bacterium RBG_13_44_8b]|nr:MAG: 6-carboxytetrahydropterin synthase QueD [Omnitrophica WOR_2 bacterium RBG_13_44_8b]
MYSIKVESNFSSAHNLRAYKGKCESLHGHNWKIEAVVAGRRVDKTGMVLDFTDLKSKLNHILEGLDHKYLNEVPYFKKVNPTSENIAKYIYDKLKAQITGLKSLTVWENNTSSATYEE